MSQIRVLIKMLLTAVNDTEKFKTTECRKEPCVYELARAYRIKKYNET